MIKNLAHCEAYIDFEADELADSRLSETFKEVSLEIFQVMQQIKAYIE